MDIAQFAMKMELDGKVFYEQQAARTRDAELKKILFTLAEEEENHYHFFKRLAEDPDGWGKVPLNGAATMQRVRNIFEDLAQQIDKPAFAADVIAAWKEARGIEEKSVAFYRTQAAAETDPGRKAMLDEIAQEEQNHVHMIDGVLTFLKFPAEFAASAAYKDFRSLEGR